MSFDKDLWDGFEATADRMKTGKTFTKEMAIYFKKRAALERDYAKKMAELCKAKTKASEIGTLDKAWTNLKSETENLAKAHSTLADAFANNVEADLTNWISQSNSNRKKLYTSGTKLLSDLRRQQGNLGKSKSKYETHRKKQDTFEAEVSSNPKVTKKLNAEKKNAEKADDDYKKQITALQDLENRFYDTEMPQILREIEQLEKERIEKVAAALNSFVKAQSAIHVVEKSTVEAIDRIVSEIDAESDNQTFISSTSTRQNKPPRTIYEPYDSAVGTCVKPPGAVTVTSSGSSSNLNASATRGIVKPIASIGSPASDKAPNAKAVKKDGSSIKDAPKKEKKKEGKKEKRKKKESGGATTAVASAATTTAATAGGSAEKPRNAAPADDDKEIGKVVALYDYVSTDEGELNFKEGDIILVYFKDPSGWWEGKINGMYGVFPKNHVKEIDGSAAPTAVTTSSNNNAPASITTSTVSAPPKQESGTAPSTPAAPTAGASATGESEKCIALYDYLAEVQGELSIKEGDVLTIEEEDDEGWYYGRNARGNYGKFPSNYVEIVS